MYWLAASRCGWRLKHAPKPSRYWPNRRSSARAEPVVTRAAYRSPAKSTSAIVRSHALQSDKVVLKGREAAGPKVRRGARVCANGLIMRVTRVEEAVMQKLGADALRPA